MRLPLHRPQQLPRGKSLSVVAGRIPTAVSRELHVKGLGLVSVGSLDMGVPENLRA